MMLRNWARLAMNPTESEKALEPAVARLGERYRAQWPFFGLGLIADFVLLDRKIVIEVDGPSHSKPEQRMKDLWHTIQLERAGWAVVRCTNDEAKGHPDVTVADLIGNRLTHRIKLTELEQQLPPGYPPKRVRKSRGYRKNKRKSS